MFSQTMKHLLFLNNMFLEYCEQNNIEKVKFYLELGANVNWRHESSQSGLHFCVTNNNEELLDLLLSQPGVDVNVTSGRYGYTALASACELNRVNIVKRLCQVSEINPNIKSNFDDSALFLALYLNHIECVKILRTVPKTNWNMKNRIGEYPIIIAIEHQSISMDILEIILSVPDLDLSVTSAYGRNVAQIAVHLRNERGQKAVKLLSRDSRVNWNIQDYYGDTPLMDCLRFMQQVDEACCMINTPGVDLNIRSSDGKYVEDIVKMRGFFWEEEWREDIYKLLSRFTGPRLRMIQRDSRQIGRMFTLQSLSCDAVLVSLISNNKKERKMQNLVNRLGNEDITKQCRQILLEAKPFPISLIRYVDMMLDPINIFV